MDLKITNEKAANAALETAKVLPDTEPLKKALEDAANAWIKDNELHVYTFISVGDSDGIAYVGSCMDWYSVEAFTKRFEHHKEVYPHFVGANKNPVACLVRQRDTWTVSVNGCNFDLPSDMAKLKFLETAPKSFVLCEGDEDFYDIEGCDCDYECDCKGYTNRPV